VNPLLHLFGSNRLTRFRHETLYFAPREPIHIRIAQPSVDYHVKCSVIIHPDDLNEFKVVGI
jgi:hypothetical protein